MWFLVVLYFCLSFLMAYTIRKLPAYCQSSWFLISTWGIFWVAVGYLLVHPEAYWHIWNLALIFLAALPGMMLLDYWQKRDRFAEEQRKKKRLASVIERVERNYQVEKEKI